MVIDFFTPAEIAERLKINERTVHRWLNAGKLNGIKLEKHWRIRKEDFDAFITAHENKPSSNGPLSSLSSTHTEA